MTLKRRKTTNQQKKLEAILYSRNRIELNCKSCGRLVTNLPPDTSAVTCSLCMVLMVEPPPSIKQHEPSGRPRGWQFMKRYVSPEGIIYERGKEIGHESLEKNTKSAKSSKKAAKKTTKRSTNKHSSAPNRKRTGTDTKKTKGRNVELRQKVQTAKTSNRKSKSTKRVSKGRSK